MVQKTFGIYADDLSGCRLFIEAGVQHIASWFADTITGSLKAFEFFQFEDVNDSSIDEVLGEIKKQSKLMSMQMDAALIIWENPACTCIPEEFFREDIAEAYIDLVVGESADTKIMHEHFKGHIILSRYPSAYADAVKKHLAAGPFSHKFSFLLKKYIPPQSDGATVVKAVFYPARLILIIIKGGVLQIIQSITYSTPEDVLYSIMHQCDGFGIAPGSTPVVLSGLITSGSSLFDTLYKYLETVQIEDSPQNTFAAEGFAEHPAQYFLPFIQ